MGDVVNRHQSCVGNSAAYKVSTIQRIYKSCIKFPTTLTSFTVLLLFLAVLDIISTNFFPDISAGGLTLIFGPDSDVIYLNGIFDHGLHFNFLYLYFIFFSIVSIIRGIVRIHNNFQGVCRYQQDAKQRQSWAQAYNHPPWRTASVWFSRFMAVWCRLRKQTSRLEIIIVKRIITRVICRGWFRAFPHDKRRGELLDPA